MGTGNILTGQDSCRRQFFAFQQSSVTGRIDWPVKGQRS